MLRGKPVHEIERRLLGRGEQNYPACRQGDIGSILFRQFLQLFCDFALYFLCEPHRRSYQDARCVRGVFRLRQ